MSNPVVAREGRGEWRARRVGTAPAAVSQHVPAVSVVIAAYNASLFIEEALESVFAQTYTDFEVFVVNDASPDTKELERRLGRFRDRIHYIRSEVRGGPSVARNLAIRRAKGRLYAQLDADDRWEPDYLEQQVRFLEEHVEVDLVYPNAILFGHADDEGLDFASLCKSEGQPTFSALLGGRCVVMTSVTARMDAIREVGMYDESLLAAEDVDLWLRLAYAGKQLAYQDRLLVHYRRSDTSLSSDRESMVARRLAVYEKVRREMRLKPEEHAALSRTEARSISELNMLRARKAWRAGDIRGAREHIRAARKSQYSLQLHVAEMFLHVFPGVFRFVLATRRSLRRAFMTVRRQASLAR